MRKTSSLIAIGIVACLGMSAAGYGQGMSLSRDIVVAVGESQESVFILGGSAVVDGAIKKSVVALGGTVTISGSVGDSVVGIGAEIILKPTAKVTKDVVAIGGKLVREAGSSVGNDTVYFDLGRLVPGFMRGSGGKGFFSMALVPLILIIKLITFFMWLLMTFLIAGVFPKQVVAASAQIRKSFWPIVGTGFLGLIIFTGLILVSALLVLILIGIPILLFVTVAALVLRVFGQVAVYHFFGQSLARSFGKQNPSPLGASLLGLVLVSFVGFIPVIGLLFSFVVSLMAFGTALFTKFGTTSNWFARKQASAQPPAPQPPVK